jgi:hypothetical protein
MPPLFEPVVQFAGIQSYEATGTSYQQVIFSFFLSFYLLADRAYTGDLAHWLAVPRALLSSDAIVRLISVKPQAHTTCNKQLRVPIISADKHKFSNDR